MPSTWSISTISPPAPWCSIEEAKSHATRHLGYKPSLRIECYTMSHLISQWSYDYQAGDWVEEVVNSDPKIYRLMK